MLVLVSRSLGLVALLGGLALLFPLWWPSPATSSHADFPGMTRASDALLSGWDDPRLARKADETDLAFTERAMRTIHRATYHCEARQNSQTLAATLAASRAPETSTFGYLDPSILRCGFCHQRAFLLTETLRRGGITNARTFGLNGHVVTLVRIGDASYMVDPDFGVGPIKYESTSYASTAVSHYSTVTDAEMVKHLTDGAFSTMGDDVEYMTHDWLLALSARQLNVVREVELQLTRAGALLVALGLVLMLAPRRITRRRETPELRPRQTPEESS